GEHGFGDIRSRAELTTDRPTQVVDEHEVIQDPPHIVVRDAVEHFHDWTDFHDEAGLLGHLTNETSLERLASLHGTTRNAPLAGERFKAALHQPDAALMHGDGAHE